MGITVEERDSDSPFVERIWRSRSESISSFISVAGFQWEIVVWTQQGKTQATIQGAQTRAVRAPVPEDAEFFGIVFKPSMFMPNLPSSTLIDSNANLPDASSQSFWLNGSSWQFPTYSNAEVFVDRLVRSAVLTHEPTVESVLQGGSPPMSLRSVQRRFLYVAGLSHRTMSLIERARRAALLLRQGTPIPDVVYELGYFDQAHMTRAVKYFIGQTPAQLRDKSHAEELSLLYKTTTFC